MQLKRTCAVLVLCAAFASARCASPSRVARGAPADGLRAHATVAQVGAESGAVVVMLERTACYGSCPAYRVSIRDDGWVEFHGESFVLMAGTHFWQLEPKQVDELREALVRERFFETELACDFEVIDTSDVNLEATLEGRTHKLVNNWDDMELPVDDPWYDKNIEIHRRLDRLADEIDEIVGSQRWIGPQ